MDDPSVRRFLDRRGVERVLPPQPRFGTEGTVRSVRPGHAPRLRRRPSARRGRRGQSGRVDLLGRGYESAVRRHSARQDVRLDDDERRRAARTGVLHRGGAGAGLHARAAERHDPERHPQGVHGPQHLYLPARILDEDHRRHLRIHVEEHAEIQLDLHFGLPYAGSRRDGRHRAGVHAGRRTGVSAYGSERRHERRHVRAPAVVLLGYRHEPLHGNRQDAGRPPALGQDREAVRPEKSQVARPAHAFADVGLVAHRARPVQQRGPYGHRGDGRRARPHAEPAHERARRGDRPADRLLGPHRPQHPDLHSGGDLRHAQRRPVGRLLLRGVADQRDRAQGMGTDPRGRKARRHGQSDRDRHSEDAHRGSGRPQTGPYRLGQRHDRRHQPLPSGEGRPDRHPRRRQHGRAGSSDQTPEGAAGEPRRGESPLCAGGHYRVRQNEKRKPAGAGRRGCEGPRVAGRDFRRLRGGRRTLQGRDPLHLRRILSRSEKRQELRTSQGYGRAVRQEGRPPAAHHDRQAGSGRP